MPEFLDEFIRQVREKKERLRAYLSLGKHSSLEHDLKNILQENWYSLPEASRISSKVAAVDGSRALRSCVVGSWLYVVNALAVLGRERIRELEVDSFLSNSSIRDVSRFVNRKMEWLEHRVALRAVERLDSGDFVLLDGTLYGRMMAVPRDSAAEEQKDFMLRYFEDYVSFLETCRERGVIPVGVSKDSRSNFLRNHLLTILLERYLEEYELDWPRKNEVRQAFVNILYSSASKGSYLKDGLPEKVSLIMWEAESPIMDHQLIANFVKSEGYSTPLELDAVGRGKSLVRQYVEAPLNYISIHFTKAYGEAQDKAGFLKWGRTVLSKIPKLPTIVSFHILLDKRDSPLRVDVPSWAVGLNNTIGNKVGITPVNPENDGIRRVVNMLQSGYGGLRNYNVFLVQAHKEVKIKRSMMDELYRRTLEKELGLSRPLMFVRRERRMGYE